MTQDNASLPAIKVSYRPKPGLGALVIKNLLLNIITLYIYSFWAKTNVRRHLWSCVTVMDEPLEYTGTGRELALGFLVVAVAVLLPLVAVRLAFEFAFAASPLRYIADIGVSAVILFLIGVGLYRARRYRLSRTLWRGIRGTLNGSPWTYGVRSFAMTLLLPFTLFWSYPWMKITLASRLLGEMEFGNRPFRFTGRPGPLYARFAILWFGTVGAFAAFVAITVAMGTVAELTGDPGGLGGAVGTETTTASPDAGEIVLALMPLLLVGLVGATFIILRSLYAAGELNYIARSTRYEGLEFKMSATAGSLLGLFVVNLLILIASMGIAGAFVQQRLMRYLCDHLTVHGILDVAAIRQSQADPGRTGEGLAEIFDIDAF